MQRDYYDPEAGPWVACKVFPHPRLDGQTMRSYPWGSIPWSGWSWHVDPAKSIRFDTKAEAQRAVRAMTHRQVKVVAHRFDEPPPA